MRCPIEIAVDRAMERLAAAQHAEPQDPNQPQFEAAKAMSCNLETAAALVRPEAPHRSPSQERAYIDRVAARAEAHCAQIRCALARHAARKTKAGSARVAAVKPVRSQPAAAAARPAAAAPPRAVSKPAGTPPFPSPQTTPPPHAKSAAAPSTTLKRGPKTRRRHVTSHATHPPLFLRLLPLLPFVLYAALYLTDLVLLARTFAPGYYTRLAWLWLSTLLHHLPFVGGSLRSATDRLPGVWQALVDGLCEPVWGGVHEMMALGVALELVAFGAAVIVIITNKIMGRGSFVARHIPRCCQWQLLMSFQRLLGGLDPYHHLPGLEFGLAELAMLADMLMLAWRAVRGKHARRRVRRGGQPKVQPRVVSVRRFRVLDLEVVVEEEGE
ncbi:hypothetical protein C8A05DRAFT_32119 [Staphylotrichum tortipilum]|uniref:Uncharacterized protein n=1 Tax=Staphylotrichum tortipilum TaxID=2831512 RepID=A0AAN6MPG7_9PEZI|nr:hypothetical protein C8A05DRAFT_32119 [Staphylotrichum longicolle]